MHIRTVYRTGNDGESLCKINTPIVDHIHYDIQALLQLHVVLAERSGIVSLGDDR